MNFRHEFVCLEFVCLVYGCLCLLGSFCAGDSSSDFKHSIGKRSGKKFHPRFQREEYRVLEGNTTLEDLVCVLAGGDVRFLSVFSARGPMERCPRFPCPQATEEEDFVPVSMHEFFLKPGVMVCVDVTLIDDEIIEGREFFLLALRDLHWGEIVDVAVVVINDDDDPSLLLTSQVVPENVGVASLCVLGGIETVTLRMELLDISTASTLPLTPQDFIVMDEGEELTVAPGGMSCFHFNIVDDDLVENVEEIFVFVTPGNNTNAMFSLGGVIKILDNDFSPTFEVSFYSARESDDSVEVCVSFIRAAASTTVSAHLTTQDDTALDMLDYLRYEADFNISGGPGGKSCHTIQLVDNAEPERTERFKVLITASNSVARPHQATVQIYDDDVLDFQNSARNYFVIEGDIVFPICVTLLSGSTNSSIAGFIYTESGSAKVGKDFRSIRRGFLFNHTQLMCFPLVILQDIFPEQQDEQLRIKVLTFSNSFFIYRSVSATVTIRDDDVSPCEDLTPPLNGRITSLSNSNNPGSVALYECDRTFILVGSSRRECQTDGVWTGTEPICEAPDAAGLDKNI